MSVEVSIIICTRNRADSLRETLRSLSLCAVPGDLLAELVVIDNGSSDNTREIVETSEMKNMPLRYVSEPRAGLCWARNRGIAETGGRILLWTDDDVRVPIDWIEGMCRPIANSSADAVAGGVRIAAELERPWLRGFLRRLAGSADGSGEKGPIRLVGANMAFSRRVLEKVPAFDVELGAGSLGFGEETLFSMQLIKAGYRILGNWELSVEHHFKADRLTREKILQIGAAMGRTDAYLCYHWEDRKPGAPLLGECWFRAKLAIRTRFGRRKCLEDMPRPWEVVYTSRVYFFQQYRRERLRPRNYDEGGLVKIRGIFQARAMLLANPMVSVILPTYNRAACVVRAVESVLRQTHSPIELIVVDDGSTDATAQMLGPYKSQIKYIYQENGGVSSARNQGLEQSTGEFLAFIDSDDLWEPNKLAVQVENLHREPSAIADICDVEISDPDFGVANLFSMRAENNGGNPTGMVPRPFAMALSGWFMTSCWMIRRRAVKERFTLGVDFFEDWEFIAKVAASGAFHLTNQVLAKMGWGQGAENLRSVARRSPMAESQRLEIFRRLLCHSEIKGDDRLILQRYASGFMQRIAITTNTRTNALSLALESLRAYPSLVNIARTGILPMRRIVGSTAKAAF